MIEPHLLLFEDEAVLVLNKPATWLSQPDGSKDKSALEVAEAHTRQPLHPIHRLDRPASGLLVFAKTEAVARHLSEQFEARRVVRTYYAIVRQPPPASAAEITHYLRKDHATNRSFAFQKPLHHTKPAVLQYAVLGESASYVLLKINLLTGRHHQIRAQLSAIGSPVKGDDKYGDRRANPDRSIDLHASELCLAHPITEQPVVFRAAAPDAPAWRHFAHLL